MAYSDTGGYRGGKRGLYDLMGVVLVVMLVLLIMGATGLYVMG